MWQYRTQPQLGLAADMSSQTGAANAPLTRGRVAATARAERTWRENRRLITDHRTEKIRIPLRQRPDAMEMIRQHHEGVDPERPLRRVARTASRSAAISRTRRSDPRSARTTVKKRRAPGDPGRR